MHIFDLAPSGKIVVLLRDAGRGLVDAAVVAAALNYFLGRQSTISIILTRPLGGVWVMKNEQSFSQRFRNQKVQGGTQQQLNSFGKAPEQGPAVPSNFHCLTFVGGG